MKNVLITILVIMVLGLGGYIVYDKIIVNDNNEKNNVENNENIDNNNQEETYDYAMFNDQIDKYLIHFIKYRVNTDGSNVISTAEGRLNLIDSVLMNLDNCTWHDDGTMQEFPYVTYETYKNKYIEFYGSDANLMNDIRTVNGWVANDCGDTSLSGNNICWNGNWGASGDTPELTATSVLKLGNNNYKITGTYAKYYYDKTVFESGNFEIEYVKIPTTKYLTSIKLIKG